MVPATRRQKKRMRGRGSVPECPLVEGRRKGPKHCHGDHVGRPPLVRERPPPRIGQVAVEHERPEDYQEDTPPVHRPRHLSEEWHRGERAEDRCERKKGNRPASAATVAPSA